MKETRKIALVGNPNSGKTSLFNKLTGLNQKVGNYPGVTVDKRVGSIALKNGNGCSIIDLPGTYSLSSSNPDERVVQRILLNPNNADFPDVLVIVVDGTNLKRNLFFASQIIDLGLPCLLVVNMIDLVRKEGKQIDLNALSQYFDVPVYAVSARGGEGLNELIKAFELDLVPSSKSMFSPVGLEEILQEVAVIRPDTTDYFRFKVMNAIAQDSISDERVDLAQIIAKHGYNPLKQDIIEVGNRADQIHRDLSIFYKDTNTKNSVSQKIDKYTTHPFWGLLIFLSVFFILFQAIFTFASYPMDLINDGLYDVGTIIASWMPPGIWADFIQDGIFAGLGGVLVFVPQIMILFALIAILEDTGYLSRVAFMSDGLLKAFGMNGKSIVPLVGGFACAIPSVMAARAIESRRERLITIFIIPLMSCSARLPVYVFLVSFIVPNEYIGGVISVQGLFMLGLYLLGLLVGLIIGFLITRFSKKNEDGAFILELPNYKIPSFRNALTNALNKGKIFVLEAGKVILIASIILWVLSYFGPTDEYTQIESHYSELLSQPNADLLKLEMDMRAELLEHSYLGKIGHLIEPVIAPLGYDWKIGIALVASFAAREVFVGTMSTIYSAETVEDVSGLDAIEFSYATAFSLLIFYVFALQCMSTIAIVKQETGGWRIPIVQFVVFTGIAYVAALLTFQLLG